MLHKHLLSIEHNQYFRSGCAYTVYIYIYIDLCLLVLLISTMCILVVSRRADTCLHPIWFKILLNYIIRCVYLMND